MLEEPSTIPAPALESEGEERSEKARLPVVTLAICAVNLLLWLLVVAVGGAARIGDLVWGSQNLPVLMAFGAKVNALIQAGDYWRLVTPMFLHLNFLHLAVNTYALLLLGGFIEQLYGRRRLLILYVMSGVCGNLASYLMNPQPSLGASTAVAGLFGTVMVFWWKYRAAMAPEYWQRMGNHLFGLLFINLMLGALFPFIDNWGHIGGLLGGMLVAVMAESRLSGEGGRAREWPPVPLALATVVGVLTYAGIEMARGAWQQRPLIAAQSALARGDYPRAATALREVVARHPNLIELRLQLAEVLARSGSLREAAEQLREGMRRHPNDPRLLQGLSEILLQSQDWAGLAPLLERQLRRSPDDPNLLTRYAQVLMETGRGEEAEPIYRRLLRDYPNEPTLLNNLAYLLADSLNRNLDEALAMARRATEAEPKNGVFWDTLGWVYFRMGRLDDAFAAQRESIFLAPREPDLHFHRGAIQEARGNRAEARAAYRRALQLRPGFSAAAQGLSRLDRS
jgi:membrane associated rhomboid family serine protease/Flp pilus assembly protein TadD